MNVSQINNTNFTSKTRMLSPGQLKNVREISNKISSEYSLINMGDNTFSLTQIGYIETKTSKDVFFSNMKDNLSEMVIGKSKLTINKKSGLTEIEKPFFKPIKKLINEAADYLECINIYFNDSKIIKKNYLNMFGYVDECDGKTYITQKKWLRN